MSSFVCVVLVLGLFFLTTVQASVTARACEASGYCSLGHTRTYIGDVRTGAALRALSEAVNFKKELLFACYIQGNGDFLDLVLQFWSELKYLGFAHFFVLGMDDASCRQVQEFSPDLSCVWDSVPMRPNSMGGEALIWSMRWRMTGRLARLGYNIGSVDADMMLLSDPYVHLKSPPLSNMTVLCQEEAGMPYCNGGFMYVQNAAPDGPATWAFRFIGEITTRMMDDVPYMMSLGNMRSERDHLCLTFDQSIIYDAFISALAGRLVLESTLGGCLPDSKRAEKDKARSLMGRLSNRGRRFKEITALPVGDKIRFAHPLPPEAYRAKLAQLQLPNMDYPWAEALGGRLLPNDTGAFTQAFLAQLRDDCPSCPWWNEHRPLLPGGDMKGEITPNMFHDEAGAVHKETMGAVPHWLDTSTGWYRVGQYHGMKAPEPVPWVFSHIHSWHVGRRNYDQKAGPRKLVGRFNWALSEAIFKKVQNRSAYSSHQPVTRVLALSPDLDLGYTRSWTELAHILYGLVQVAFLTDRTPVFPNLPCHTAWIHGKGADDPHRSPETLCEIPVLTGDTRFDWPVPFPFPVQANGDLVGGWSAGVTPGVALTDQFLHLDQGQAGRPAAAGHGSAAAGSSSTSSTTNNPDGSVTITTVTTIPAKSADGPTSAAVASDGGQPHRVMAAMHLTWDSRCTEDLGAIFMPELFHWLTTNASTGAQLVATDTNTAMLLAESAAEARPWYTRSAQATRHTVRGLLKPQAEKGWSLADVQVATSVGAVLREMHRFQKEPLVYLGHPVVAVPSQRDTPAALRANDMLEEAEKRIRSHHEPCRALMMDPAEMNKPWEFDKTEVVSPAKSSLHATMRDNKLHLAGMRPDGTTS
ncbi:hypothetical protein V8C86DRAFT_2894510 [Haematococcus lacustris]